MITMYSANFFWKGTLPPGDKDIKEIVRAEISKIKEDDLLENSEQELLREIKEFIILTQKPNFSPRIAYL